MENSKKIRLRIGMDIWNGVQTVIHREISNKGMVAGYDLRNLGLDFSIFRPDVYWIFRDSFRKVDELTNNEGKECIIEIDEPYGIVEDGKMETRSKAIEKIEVTDFDPVSKPSHYTEGRKYEPRKVIYDWGLDFNLGNAVKYISRAGRKNDAIEDLKKAIQYIEFELEELENEQSVG